MPLLSTSADAGPHSEGTSNQASLSVDHSDTADQKYTALGYRREEMVRLLIQCIKQLGYSDSALLLEQESGFQLETHLVSQFRDNVLSGEWNAVEALLESMQITDELLVQKAKFLIKKQKYMELLENKKTKEALLVLRNEITPLKCDSDELHELSSLMMCSSLESLKKKSGWTGLGHDTRSHLFVELQQFIPSSLIIPDNRLETLIKQAQKLQEGNCLYHTQTNQEFSLYHDHTCERSDFPGITTHILEEHSDEVWFVSFSHSGDYLASASKDSSAIIWDVSTWRPIHSLKGHEEAVSFLSWSPDDSMLLTCSNDNKVRLWDTKTGTCKRVFSRHLDAVTSCAWFPDNKRFVTSSLDRTIYLWELNGDLMYRWLGARVTDLALNKDGSKLIAICHEKKIRIYDLAEKTELCIQEESAITSLNLSADSRHALVNTASQEIHLWDLQEKRLIQKYAGQKQGRFVIRSCFGGYNQGFVVSGSEDSNVYIWHRSLGKLVEVLSGHTGTVNSVSWNPKRPHMFASASDDCSIRVWGRAK